jgi:hypothetical protein
MQLKLIRKANFEELFPIWSLEEHFAGQGKIIFKDGRIGIGFKGLSISNRVFVYLSNDAKTIYPTNSLGKGKT